MIKKYIPRVLSRLVALAMLLSSFLSFSAVSPSSPAIVLSQTSGQNETGVTVSGHDFSPNYYYYIFGAQRFLLGRGIIDGNGAFSSSITIRSNSLGEYEILVYASASRQSYPSYNGDYDEGAVTFFTLKPTPSPAIQLNPQIGKPGSNINVSGKYFSQNYHLYIFFDNKYLAKSTIDNNGNFNQSVTIPETLGLGNHDITAVANKIEDTSPSINKNYDETATTYFNVVYLLPSITIDKTQGKVADKFTLSGTDFGSGDIIIVYWDGTQIGSTFFPTLIDTFENKSFSVPETYSGLHTIKVANKTQESSLSFTVVPSVTLSSDTINPGDQIIISGTGFAALSEITFFIDDTAVPVKVTTTAKGTLGNTTFAVPDIPSGSYEIKVRDNAGNLAAGEINVSIPQVTTAIATAISTVSPTMSTPSNISPTHGQNAVAPSSILPTTSTLSPIQSAMPSATGSPTQPEPTQKSPSAFPVWGIIIIMIIAIIVVAGLIRLIIRRRRTFYFKKG